MTQGSLALHAHVSGIRQVGHTMAMDAVTSKRAGIAPSIVTGATLGVGSMLLMGNANRWGIVAGLGIGGLAGAASHVVDTNNPLALVTSPIGGVVGGAIAGAVIMRMIAHKSPGNGPQVGALFGMLYGGILGGITGVASLIANKAVDVIGG